MRYLLAWSKRYYMPCIVEKGIFQNRGDAGRGDCAEAGFRKQAGSEVDGNSKEPGSSGGWERVS